MIRVLVADDEALERQAMLHILGGVEMGEHLDVREARNGLEALELARESKPDVAFVDIRMPGMDGLGVVKEFSLLPDPPIVIMVTAYDYFSYARTALRFGVFDYLLKPASTEDILGVFRRALQVIAERRNDAARRMADRTVAADIQKTLYADICKELGSGTVDDEDIRRLISFQFEPQAGIAGWMCVAVVAAVERGSGNAAVSIASREFSRFFRALAERHLLSDVGFADANALLFISSAESSVAQIGSPHALIVVPELDNDKRSIESLRKRIGEGIKRFSQRCEAAGGAGVRVGIGVGAGCKAMAALRTAKIAFNLSKTGHPILIVSSAHEIRKAETSPPDSLSARAVMWIQDHFMESMGIQDLAHELGVSPSCLSHTLKRELGTGFGETLARVRVACAKDILANGASAKEASFLVGFRDQSYFTKVFVKIEGLSPSQYVRTLRASDYQQFA